MSVFFMRTLQIPTEDKQVYAIKNKIYFMQTANALLS